jgi:hypothetical protein
VPQLGYLEIQPGAGIELAVPLPIALVRSFITALPVAGSDRASASAPIRVWMTLGQQLTQHIRVSAGESFGQQLGPVDIVGSGHRIDSFARVTLTGLSKNHAMTFIHPATTHAGPLRLLHHSAGHIPESKTWNGASMCPKRGILWKVATDLGQVAFVFPLLDGRRCNRGVKQSA